LKISGTKYFPPKCEKKANYEEKTMSRDRGLKSIAYDIACSFISRCEETVVIDLIEGTITPHNHLSEDIACYYVQMLCDQIDCRKLPVNIVHKARLQSRLDDQTFICEVNITDCRGRIHIAEKCQAL